MAITANAPSSLLGKTALITGSTGGLGFETAVSLAARGANVILSGRSLEKGHAALQELRHRVPTAIARFEVLDLASLASIAECAASLKSHGEPLHFLANNAGVMAPAQRLTTKDGFELQFGTNHLGHFALTGHLLPLLARGEARIMTVASLAAKKGSLPFGDLNARHHYQAFERYQQSKLANLLFAFELDRRAKKAPWPIHSRAAHPGWSASNIMLNNAAFDQKSSLVPRLARKAIRSVGWKIFTFMGQDVAQGAEPLLYALTAPQAKDGGYYGPKNRDERRGPPAEAFIPALARDPELARRLWTLSETMTGVRYGLI
ncbi:oxidoreductase [Neokomagataea thailandica NBRC 106555]|uniref:SDR family NAD(P)-dependent oxidoreductase n=2 Tax=Neokomagataea TaxID=1223423 RepID=A0A4Y6V730_9PROT|nr:MULTISPECIES: SDR family oxidoreductase [Neokomagataea]QDH24668.1 SDR family NAD(P)-dependent oxidoreductase [Neokomagataea tanensis]GBR53882.1 oxidoreductase [Neokomagataea thailandica NBRC 106555]